MKTLALTVVSFIVLCGSSATEEQEIKRTEEFKSAVVSITRYFTPEEIKDPDRVGNQGTAWFFMTRKHLVTIEHVVSDPPLSTDKWTEVWLLQQHGEKKEDVRTEKCQIKLLQILPNPKGEGLALLELKEVFKWGKVLLPEREMGEKDEEVFSLGYPDGCLSYAVGSFHGTCEANEEYKEREGLPLYELSNNIDRLSFNHGASGAPVLNTKGNVVGVLSTLFTQKCVLLGQEIETGTAWGEPTHIAVSTTNLAKFKFPD